MERICIWLVSLASVAVIFAYLPFFLALILIVVGAGAAYESSKGK
jgi:hypothetical protein